MFKSLENLIINTRVPTQLKNFKTSTAVRVTPTLLFFKPQRRAFMTLKPGPKPIAKSTGKPDQRHRDNKTTPGNTPSLKPSKSSNPQKGK